jgi:hypothetical protein
LLQTFGVRLIFARSMPSRVIGWVARRGVDQ